MKAALFIVLSLSALAFAGPAFNKNTNNQIDTNKAHQQQQHMTTGDVKQTAATEILKEWCFSSQMSQPELTASFKKLLNVVKSSPEDQTTEAAVMSERICQGAIVQKSAQSGDTLAQSGADVQAHELIKDVYMDALIACETSECMQQLVKIINSNKVDTIRASYYMTRIAVTERDSIKDDNEQAKQLAESFLNSPSQSTSDAIERQKLFAITALLNKALKSKQGEQQQQQSSELKQTAEQVAKTIVDRYIKPVSQQEVQQYTQQQPQQQSSQVAKKIAKRNAALKALANIPGWLLKDTKGIEEILVQLAQNKQEMTTTRQSAIECLEENDSVYKQLKQICFDQDEPIEVRVAALRALMTVVYAGKNDEQSKQQIATEIVDQVVKHCEDQRNQQQDDQFVLYAISYLDNLRTSQQPEHQAIKECIAKNKQHYMQIQLLCKKLKEQLSDIRRSSRNYKLDQEFNQLESGLVIEGDLVYESKHNTNKQQHQQVSVLPKLVRFNMSMPVMGETVNVVEITIRQNQMDQELLGALKLVQGAKFNSESVSKVVDSFKSSVGSQQQQQSKSAEADLSIKVDGCTIVYMCVDDFKSASSSSSSHQRNTRSVYSSVSIIDDIIEHLKRKPVAFNRGFNFNLNQRLAKVLDVDANLIAGLRFESRASGQSSKDFEIVTQIEPRFAFEAIVGPAKMSSKKLLQRLSTKTALGLRLRFKSNELVDVQIDLPMNTMELFTVESQLVEKSQSSYNYLANSIYGQEDIYSPDEDYYCEHSENDDDDNTTTGYKSKRANLMKRSIFEKKSSGKSLFKFMQSSDSKRSFAHSLETPEDIARATGLRAKLRVVASPSDMSFLVQCVAQKYEPRMQGYRVQVQKVQRGNEQKQYIFTLSTPGSRVDRTMQVRVIKQTNSQRTIVKSDIQTPKMAATGQYEIIYDGRQYAIKAEIASSRGKQWRHSFETGVQRGSQSQSGRIATTYKPYISLESTSLRRPVQMQGVVSYQQQPKSVISYELKNPTTGDFVQGKIIFDQRSSSYNSKRGNTRRSMQSPLDLYAQDDLTLTGEFVAQVGEQYVKVHKMIDWDSSKRQISADMSSSHKNLRKSSVESQLLVNLKLDKEQQMFTVQRKCPQQERKEFQLTVASDLNKSQTGHQMVAEYRYYGKRQSNAIVAYKHKIDFSQISSNKLECGYTVELIASECQMNEKFTGRTQIGFDRKMKTLKTEMSSRGKSCKIDAEFVSFEQHQIELNLQSERLSHRTSIRADQRQYNVQSRTEKNNNMLAKLVLDVLKQQDECKLVLELPTKNSHYAADLKFQPGKLSSVAIQTPRFASKAEFSFENMTRGNKRESFWKQPFAAVSPFSQMKFKSHLKDNTNQEAYWIDSLYNSADQNSYLRFDSPTYRSDVEFEPRDESTKFGLFARSNKPTSNYNKLYSNEESVLNQVLDNKLNLGDKMWMLRGILSSPSSSLKGQELKQKARRALFEYADRRQSHKHSFNVDPIDERVNFNFERQANSDYPTSSGRSTITPMRWSGDLSTNYWTNEHKQQRPSTLSMESEYVDFDFDTKPFDGEECYAKLTALSRHRRSPFSKHESEYRYKKHGGYKAYMKHQDAQQKKHSVQFESDESPKNWAKMSFESDKHGKADYEHKWRKFSNKRSTDDQDEYYQNQVKFQGQSLKTAKPEWSHHSNLQWDEPKRMIGGRMRRDINDDTERDYSVVDYLKHLNARLNSQTYRNQAELYNIDFDYKPESHVARLNVNMPNDMLHASNIEFLPTDRLYKLQSRLVNRRTNEPSYEFLASTKSIAGLATSEQEPMFINEQHSMLERPITNALASNLFRQPLKLDYSDKFGRIARFDYDQSPIVGGQKYAGLRQKRAALYYKDDSMDFEHLSSYDFYPEALLGGFKQSKRVSGSGDFSVKTNTKYGPIVLRADSNEQTVELQLESPIIKAKLTSESSTSKRGTQLIRWTVDNKDQRVQLNKVIRQSQLIASYVKDCEIIQKMVNKFDQGKFEHQSELLVSLVDAIFKIKSQTSMNQRSVLLIDGELNRQQEKAYVKIDGERTKGQLIVDLINKSANLVLDVDDKRTVQHQTRVTRLNDKFYSLESVTSYKQQPLFKLSGKVSAMILSEPQHLFARRRSGSSAEEHISSFEAVVFEPKHLQITGQYDCLKKEARIVFRDVEDKKIQETRVAFDDQTETIIVDARLSSPQGQIYNSYSKINLASFMQPNKCNHRSCQSEVNYSEKSGNWSAKYAPGGFVSINTPFGKRW